ncbi:MAG: hypothetical protein HPY66_0122 [Firmicutes bacterium]|nr:hypothetical protein [Bacillota bacterium]
MPNDALSELSGVLPGHAPSYPLEWSCSDAHTFTITIEGEDTAIKEILAYTPFEYVSNIYQISFSSLNEHTLALNDGGYLECAVTLPVRYKDICGGYIPYMYCTYIPAILAGREVYGYPKQHADITWIETSIAAASSVRKNGVELVKSSFVYDDTNDYYLKEVEEIEKINATRLLYKTVPSGFGGKPDIRQIILRDTGRKTLSESIGRAAVKLGVLKSDPIYRLGIKRILGAKFSVSKYGGGSKIERCTLITTL